MGICVEINQKIPKPLNYPEKLAYCRERRELVLQYIGSAIKLSVHYLEEAETDIQRWIKAFNASIRAAGIQGKGLELVKPRRQSLGLYAIFFNNLNVSMISMKKKDISLLANTLSDGDPNITESLWLATQIARFINSQWLSYRSQADVIDTAITNLYKIKGLQKTSEWHHLRNIWIECAYDRYQELVNELIEIDSEIDDVQFRINSIGGTKRGYKSIICRWPLDDEKYRYSRKVIIDNPEIAYVAYNLGSRRITRPINKIKGIGESGFITQRLIKHLRQRRNQRALTRWGDIYKKLYTQRDSILKNLEPTVNALQGASQ